MQNRLLVPVSPGCQGHPEWEVGAPSLARLSMGSPTPSPGAVSARRWSPRTQTARSLLAVTVPVLCGVCRRLTVQGRRHTGPFGSRSVGSFWGQPTFPPLVRETVCLMNAQGASETRDPRVQLGGRGEGRCTPRAGVEAPRGPVPGLLHAAPRCASGRTPGAPFTAAPIALPAGAGSADRTYERRDSPAPGPVGGRAGRGTQTRALCESRFITPVRLLRTADPGPRGAAEMTRSASSGHLVPVTAPGTGFVFPVTHHTPAW